MSRKEVAGKGKVAQIKSELGPQSPRGESPAKTKLVCILLPPSLPLSHSPIISSSSFLFFDPRAGYGTPNQVSEGDFDHQYAVKLLCADDGAGCLCNITLSIERHIFRLVPVGQSGYTPPIEMQILLRSLIVFVLVRMVAAASAVLARRSI